ncbi:MAG: hypothetical protein D6698_04020 [Gammaproteobacteria bacterium]|nr:MAG: hypothetical protein D6698_04020 [Gammaproteobacteria bacterium]
MTTITKSWKNKIHWYKPALVEVLKAILKAKNSPNSRLARLFPRRRPLIFTADTLYELSPKVYEDTCNTSAIINTLLGLGVIAEHHNTSVVRSKRREAKGRIIREYRVKATSKEIQRVIDEITGS